MICVKCKEDKSDECFPFRNVATGIRNKTCRVCHAEYVKTHYKNNKAAYVARTRDNSVEERKKTIALLDGLKAGGCVKCGDTRLPVLDFHHEEPGLKEHNISQLKSRKKIKAESKKCIILCSNCHRMEHYLLRNSPL